MSARPEEYYFERCLFQLKVYVWVCTMDHSVKCTFILCLKMFESQSFVEGYYLATFRVMRKRFPDRKDSISKIHWSLE